MEKDCLSSTFPSVNDLIWHSIFVLIIFASIANGHSVRMRSRYIYTYSIIVSVRPAIVISCNTCFTKYPRYCYFFIFASSITYIPDYTSGTDRGAMTMYR